MTTKNDSHIDRIEFLESLLEDISWHFAEENDSTVNNLLDDFWKYMEE